MSTLEAITACMDYVLRDRNVARATKYLSPTLVVKVSAQVFGKRRVSIRDRQETFVVTVGKPNAEERAWITSAKKAGKSFPAKQVQWKFLRQPKRHVRGCR
jgi:hypothetical protein